MSGPVYDLGFSELSLESLDQRPPAELVELLARRTGIEIDIFWSKTFAKNKRSCRKTLSEVSAARTVPPVKRKNIEKRTREYLTLEEVKKLIDSAKSLGRHGDRDALLILMSYRHALRLGEVIDLRWRQLDLAHAHIHVHRLKNGDPSVHFLERDEIRALRQLERAYPKSDFVFTSERKGRLTPNAVHKIIVRAGEAAGINFPVHQHMLRHGKGHDLAKRGVNTRYIQAYMGHKNIQNTAIYAKFDASALKGLGKDVNLD